MKLNISKDYKQFWTTLIRKNKREQNFVEFCDLQRQKFQSNGPSVAIRLQDYFEEGFLTCAIL